MEENPNKDTRPLANNDAATTLVNGDAGDQSAGPTDKEQGYATETQVEIDVGSTEPEGRGPWVAVVAIVGLALLVAAGIGVAIYFLRPPGVDDPSRHENRVQDPLSTALQAPHATTTTETKSTTTDDVTESSAAVSTYPVTSTTPVPSTAVSTTIVTSTTPVPSTSHVTSMTPVPSTAVSTVPVTSTTPVPSTVVPGSCNERCSETFDAAYNCQCNSQCEGHGDCCSDYEELCTGIDSALSQVMQDLWDADINRFSTADFTFSASNGSMFTYVNEDRLNVNTYKTFIDLLDNYNHVVKEEEIQSPESLQEIETYLDEILLTEVMNITFQYLVENEKIPATQSAFRNKLKELWFDFYPRSSSQDFDDSSGFEHVMVGELKLTTVKGFHNWLQMYLEEKAGNLQFTDLISSVEPRMRAVSFTWHGRNKAKGAFFLGTSPEFDMAVYSICALEYRNTLCEFILEGVKVAVQTYDINHRAGLQIGSAWPAI